MSVEFTYSATATVQEVLTNNPESAAPSGRKITHNQFNTALNLDGDSTPAVSKVAAFVQALSTGTATIDLTSLEGTNGATVNGDGLAVQALKVNNLGDNALTIEPGSSNPYNLFGSSSVLDIPAGGEILMYANGNAPSIASGSAAELDLTGTSSEESEWIIVMG